LPVLARYPDGSYLSLVGGTRMRIIECAITIATAAGTRTGVYRLATTLTEQHTYPAAELITLYHQRWEIETAYLELKSSMLGGRVLRSHTADGVDQEIYALLLAYQILRIAITDATDTTPGVDPDRASFTIALHAAHDQIIQAAGVITETVIDLVGTIGRHVLDNLQPTRRLRVSPRTVKRPLSRYAYHSLRISRKTYKATLNIDIHPAPPLTTVPDP
ncbi:MAG: transposase, partial [Sciscionella sp.]